MNDLFGENHLLKKVKLILPFIQITTEVIGLMEFLEYGNENFYCFSDEQAEKIIKKINLEKSENEIEHDKQLMEALSMGSLGIPFIQFYLSHKLLLSKELRETLTNKK